jgi:hypothetical protein
VPEDRRDSTTRPNNRAKYAPWVSLLRDDSHYLRTAPAPAYWALTPYYVGQFTESACSLATAVMVANAARRGLAREAGSRLVTQESLLEAVDSRLWRASVDSDTGRGVSLHQMADLLAAGLRAVGAPPADIAAVPLSPSAPDASRRLCDALRAGEERPGTFTIANFHMAAVIGDGDYGHFSPIGAYDATRDRVLVLDVYRVELEPYWVPLQRLVAGMATISSVDGAPRGYLTVAFGGR